MELTFLGNRANQKVQNYRESYLDEGGLLSEWSLGVRNKE
jgi:hypothetical protein